MQGKFRFSLDGVDATARQFADVRGQLRDLSTSVGGSVSRLGERVTAVEDGLVSLAAGEGKVNDGGIDVVAAPAHGGTGVRNVYSNPLSLPPLRTVYCRSDGGLGVDCSSKGMVVDVVDADEFLPLEALRRVRWRVYRYRDDLNQGLDDAQPVVGLLAEDLHDAGLGFFCEYDDDGDPVGVDYARLSVAALRLAQEALDEVGRLKTVVGGLASEIGRMKGSNVTDTTVGE